MLRANTCDHLRILSQVSHRDCATKLKNLSLDHKDKNSKKITRNMSNPGRRGTSLLRPNSSVQKKEMSNNLTESCPRNTRSASRLKQPARLLASHRKLLRMSVAARESPSNVRPVTPMVSADSSALGDPTFDADAPCQQLSTCSRKAACCSTLNPLPQSFDLPSAAPDEDSASDLSDSERIPLESSPCRPPDLNLRAEVIVPADLTPTSSCAEFNYPDFLPEPYASWNLRELSLLVNSSSNARSPVTARPMGFLESFVGRLLALEWLQLKTEQAERSRLTRPRSNTAPGSCNPARHPGRGRRACLMLPSSPGYLAIGPACTVAGACSHCWLRYPDCIGNSRPEAYQNFSRSSSTKQRGTGSPLRAGGQPKARAFLGHKEAVLGKGPSETAFLHCSSTAKARKQRLRTLQCAPPCPYHSPSASLRLCMMHQGECHTGKMGSREQSLVVEKDFSLDNRSRGISNSNGKGKRQLRHLK
ncbi:uncharacterized protein LOC125461374 isoform X2 [Stegostoma tigrinum]|uniref:uncharacterized protein LOC125461374 isoform X2 n=1 Tax=Stegostoma tigrinum TaxID=3053191 RepID=UPI0028706E8D|nr:uncharacterized protein LOC125461374 isoform X2 [Stegostoma tigrinum]